MSVLWGSFLSDKGDHELKVLERNLREILLLSPLNSRGMFVVSLINIGYLSHLTITVRMGIVELLAAFTLKPNQPPAERRETIELGNELIKVGTVNH